MEPWFSFEYNYPRTTTRWEYKRISHWLRSCRRLISEQIDLSEFEKTMEDVMFYGFGIWKRPLSTPLKSQ